MLGLPEEFTPSSSPASTSYASRRGASLRVSARGRICRPRGSSLEFSDFRHYSDGDDFRYIDWGLYGRTDKLYIKLFKEEEDLLTYIFIDASASMGFPAGDRKFESAVAMALALAYVALASGDRVMIRVIAGRGPRRPGVRLRAPSDRRARARPDRHPPGRRGRSAPALARELVSIRRAGKVFLISTS